MRTVGAGSVLGRYRVLRHLADGGMARVWAAEQAGDLGFRKLVALKTIRPEHVADRNERAMFIDEALLAARVRHPNVVEIYDLGVEGDVVYQAMALVEGTSLAAWRKRTRLPLPVAIRVALDMLRGLHAAHTAVGADGRELGLVHRDVSPQNVLIGLDGVAKLSDFGIAKASQRLASETVCGAVKGKRSYLAPEQLDGKPATRRSDIFSAAVVLWELLTGHSLYGVAGKAVMGLIRLPIPDPRAYRAEVPASLAAIVTRASSEDPASRYTTAREMADAIEDALPSAHLVACHHDVAQELAKELGAEIEHQRNVVRGAARKRKPGAHEEATRAERAASAPRARRTPFDADPATQVKVANRSDDVTLERKALELDPATIALARTPLPTLPACYAPSAAARPRSARPAPARRRATVSPDPVPWAPPPPVERRMTPWTPAPSGGLKMVAVPLAVQPPPSGGGRDAVTALIARAAPPQVARYALRGVVALCACIAVFAVASAAAPDAPKQSRVVFAGENPSN